VLNHLNAENYLPQIHILRDFINLMRGWWVCLRCFDKLSNHGLSDRGSATAGSSTTDHLTFSSSVQLSFFPQWR